MNVGFDSVTACTSSTKPASRVVGALVERVLTDHVGDGQPEQLPLPARAERLAALRPAEAVLVRPSRPVRSGWCAAGAAWCRRTSP